MATLEERVSFLEGRLAEQSTILVGIQHSLTSLDHRVQALDERLDRKLQALDSRISTQFTWLVGILITTLAALFVAVLAHS